MPQGFRNLVVKGLTSVPRNWLKEDLFKSLFKNAATLLSGNLLASMLGLASLAITARALGPESFGKLVLVSTYVLIVDSLVNFQSTYALITYGAAAIARRRDQDFKSLIKFGTILDSSSALLGMIIAIAGLYVANQWRLWSQETTHIAALYAVVILFNLSGTPVAILRLFDRFKLIALYRVVGATFKLVGVTLAFLTGAGIWGFVIVWMLKPILDNVLLLAMGWRELRKKHIHNVFSASVRSIAIKHPGIWPFVWSTNFHVSLRSSLKEFDTILVGMILGPSAVGLYKIVKQFSLIISVLIDPLNQVILPYLSKLWATANIIEFRRLIFRSAAVVTVITACAYVAFAVYGHLAIDLTVGAAYADAYPLILIYMVGVLIALGSFSFHPAILAMGLATLSLKLLVISSLVYYLSLFYLVNQYGLIGAAVSYIVFYLVWVPSLCHTIIWRLRRTS